MKRSIAALAATAGLLVFASTAIAGEALPEDTSTTTTPPTTSTPTTEVPATTTTEVPATTTTTVPTTTTTTTVPTTDPGTTIPTTTDEVPCVADCIPQAEAACTGADCLPIGSGAMPTTVGAGAALPFTGIGDMIAPILLALVVVIGGVVAWRWAQLREAVAEAATRARQLPARQVTRTGYEGAMRQLHIEHRARRVFTARVA